MSRKLIRNFKIIAIIFVIALGLFGTSCFAASFDIKASKTTLNVGDTASVTIKVNDCFGKFTVSSSDSSIVSVSNTSIWIEHGSGSGSFTITAKKAGTATITITAKEASDLAGDNDITGSKPITITVSEPKKEEPKTETPKTETPKAETPAKSSDATLKSITVGGKKYNNPGTNITANSVNAETSSIKIEAQTNDSKAKVTGTGTKDLVTGTNKFTLKVTAENGSTKSYTVKVTKLAEEITTPNIVEEQEEEEIKSEEQELRLSSLIIEGAELIPKFETEIFEYSVYVTNINELKINATANDEEAKIEITGNTNLIEGENVALIKVTKDEKIAEYKVIINKAGLTTIQENTDTKIDKNQGTKIGFIGQIKDWWNKSGILTVLLAGILGLFSMAVSFAITTYKYSKPVVETSKHAKEDKNI